MLKLLKISGRSIGILLEWFGIFIILFAFVIRTSPVQTYLAKQVTDYLSDELHARLKVDKVSIIFPNEIKLEGLLVEDELGDTLIATKSIYATIFDYDLKGSSFHIKNAVIDEATINIHRFQNGDYNYFFLQDYFESKSTRSNKFTLIVDAVLLTHSKFKYDEDRHERKSKGVDYFHINAYNINTLVDNFKLDGRVYSGEIKSFNCDEKSGFQLKNLKTKALVHSEGIYLSDLAIKSPGSRINAKKFNMLSTGFTDFREFVDSVRFDGAIEKSKIALSEASLFAYVLDGMNDTVYVKGQISRKVPRLKLTNLDLRIKNNIRIKGTLNLPDYRKPKKVFLHEKLDYLKIDVNELQSIKLPNSASQQYIIADERIRRLEFFEAEDIRVDGFYAQFVVAADIVRSKLGSVKMDNGIMFTRNEKNKSYFFEKSGASSYDVKIENFHLGKLLPNPDVGIIDGIFFLSGEAYSTSNIRFSLIEGDINKLEYLNYPYQKIKIIKGSFENEIFTGKIDVRDDNLNLTYDGFIDFKNELHMVFEINVRDALLDNFNLSSNNSRISSTFRANLRGTDPNSFVGKISMDGFSLTEKNKKIDVPSLRLNINRGLSDDEMVLKSDLVDFNLKGKINFKTIQDKLNHHFNKVFPSIFKIDENDKKASRYDHFEFTFTLKESVDFLDVFVPGLYIAPGTKIVGHFDEAKSDIIVNLTSNAIYYNNILVDDISLYQVIDQNSIVATYHAGAVIFKDSIQFEDVYFKSTGKNGRLNSNLTWELNKPSSSSISWETEIDDYDHYKLEIDPSYFTIQNHKWEIAQKSKVEFKSDTIVVNDFILLRNNQSISIDGTLSSSQDHHLNFLIKDLIIGEISSFVSKVPIEGNLNAYGYFSNPFQDFNYSGKANIEQLSVKERLVGDVRIDSDWIKSNKSIALQGDLIYRGNQTFDFIGDYYPSMEKDNLDFNLFFDYTDIQFANAFLNPEVVSEVKGLLNGTLKVTGSPDNPILDGKVQLFAGSAKVDILGSHFGLEGSIEVDEYGFYVNGIPIIDEDGNAGLVIGSVYHDNFADFNFDLLFDLEIDAFNKDPLRPWMTVPLDRFLVLNSDYEQGDLYYGKGYATGTVNIFGYTDNLEINVDLETEKGTEINIPMYGVGEIDTENNFITFTNKGNEVLDTESQFDFTGVDLNLNFKITPSAQLKIIFNEELGDEITAHGYGDMAIQLDNLGSLNMDGIFYVNDGVYDFALGPLKQKFFIEKGGNISWLGDPYDAVLNLRTYYKVSSNISTLTSNQFGTGAVRQEVLCYLNLTEALSKPAINFDLEVRESDEYSRSLITRIKSDPDELNRQFFSLLLWKRFQPLSGNASADGSAAIELVTNQINAILSKVSNDYQLNVNVNADQRSGESSYEFGVSKGFLDDRLVLSGSFGVENQKLDEDKDENAIIGDVKLEYLLNQPGTFRVAIFNESNDKSIIQSQEQGRFTQGVGINYKEDFHTFKEFKAIQYFLDIFRKKKNKRYPKKRKREQVPIPKNNPRTIPAKPESSPPTS